jgi:hypothetical protein
MTAPTPPKKPPADHLIDAAEEAKDAEEDLEGPACVMVFNASDPSGAGGLAADTTAIASVGGHALPVVTGAYARDTGEIFEHFCFDEEAVTEQARAVLEDIAVQVFKVGFVGSPENVSAIAEITSDYADVPVIAYMPNLSWWDEDKIDDYLDAFRELMLPQTTVLVGNHSTLRRWLLPDWDGERNPARATSPRPPPPWAWPTPWSLASPCPTSMWKTYSPARKPCWSAKSSSCLKPYSPARAKPCRPHWRPCWPAAATWLKPPMKP